MKTIEQPAMQAMLAEATQVWVPKGSEADTVRESLSKMGVMLPELGRDCPDGVMPDGTSATIARAKDIVSLLELGIGEAGADGQVRSVGFAGLDVAKEYIDGDPDSPLQYAVFGADEPPMCNFEALFPKRGGADEPIDPELIERLQNKNLPPVRVVTGLPNMLARIALQKGLNMEPVKYSPGGGVEIIAKKMIAQGFADIAVDLVKLGGAAKWAGFWTSKTLPEGSGFDPVLDPVYPVVMQRRSGVERPPKPIDLNNGIAGIDATLIERYAQVDDSDALVTDTLRLLRSPQKAGGKTFEERMELALAAMNGETDAATTAELADLVRADLLFANSLRAKRGLGAITVRDVLEVLVGRNQASTRSAT